MNTSLHFEDAGNDGPDVDTLITGLVREYLFRKGYYEALQAYDEEVVCIVIFDVIFPADDASLFV